MELDPSRNCHSPCRHCRLLDLWLQSTDLGLPLAGFFAVLMINSWSLGLTSAGILLGYGLGAWGLAWSLGILLLPLVVFIIRCQPSRTGCNLSHLRYLHACV